MENNLARFYEHDIFDNVVDLLAKNGIRQEDFDALSESKLLKLSLAASRPFDEVDYQFRHQGLDADVYEAYCWLWRNVTVRLSNLLSEYEGKEPSALAFLYNEMTGLVKP